MRKTLRPLIACVGCFGVVALSAWANPAREASEAREALPAARVTLVQAYDQAVERLPDGIPIRVKLGVRDDVAQWGVSLLSGKNTQTLWFDAVSGALTADETDSWPTEGQFVVELVKRGPVGIKEAARVAGETYPGAQVYDVRVGAMGDVLFYEVRLLEGESERYAKLDEAGVVISRQPGAPRVKRR